MEELSDRVDGKRDRGDTWGRRYLGVSAAGTALLTGTVLDLAVFQALSGVGASFLILLAFSALTVAKLRLDGEGRDRTGVGP